MGGQSGFESSSAFVLSRMQWMKPGTSGDFTFEPAKIEQVINIICVTLGHE
jgi:hypothetical protein